MLAKPNSQTLVLDVWEHIEPQFGGVGPAASALATAAATSNGIKSRQIAICEPFEVKRADGIDPRTETIKSHKMRGWTDLQIANQLEAAIADSDVCHVHGVWSPHCLAVRRLASRNKKPVVSSVHGMLEQWELNKSRLKKSVYSWLFERPSIRRSMCLRALSEREVGDFRRYGTQNPIALVPNGINAIGRVETESLLSRFPQLKDKQMVLYLGRVHHKKGVLNLAKAWKLVSQIHADSHLLIAGPDYVGTTAKLAQLISEMNLDSSVTITGTITGHTKLAALSAARFFCLPSYSEGLSVAVLEALSIGLPAIITPECNIPSAASAGAAVSTSNEPQELAQTITSCLNLSSREWQCMSEAAQNLARTQFSWEVTGNTIRSVYEWLLGGNKPECVIA